jgi:L-ascorbate metabolism protein UlaG (beta-lactamase superfamily)
MKITKYGHCSMQVEVASPALGRVMNIMFDPGNLSTLQNSVTGIDLIIITHEHADHYHVESLKAVLAGNPQAKIIANKSVGVLLEREGLTYETLVDGEKKVFHGVLIEAVDGEHVEIFDPLIPRVENTGYFVEEKFFFPGDAYTVPKKPVEILALPVAGPWCKVADAAKYLLAVKPKVAFPVHDGGLKVMGGNHRIPQVVAEGAGIKFVIPEIGLPFTV